MLVQNIPLNQIKLGENSRLTHSDEELYGLMQAIKESGLLQPIGLVKKASNKYEIAYGNRRFLAWQKLYDNKPIPAVIHENQGASEVEIKNLVENIQRRNISIGEAGRYFQILRDRGMSTREIAVRIGCSSNFVKVSIDAHNKIPLKFRDKVTSSFGGKHVAPGEINYKTAQGIVSAAKTYRLKTAQTSRLFEAAIKDPEKFQMPENIQKYGAALSKGKEDFMATTVTYRNIDVRFHIPEKECERLEVEYLSDGPFKSFQGLLRAIIRGEKNVKIKCL